jgi:hypothetical protein
MGGARPSARRFDILAALHRRGAISAEMRQAGEDFRSTFRRARLDPLKAQNLMRTAASHADGVSFGVFAARENLWRAIGAVGGVHLASGACLWHVLGAEVSLKEWALGYGWSGHFVSQEAATGVLISALGMLAQHYHLLPGDSLRG